MVGDSETALHPDVQAPLPQTGPPRDRQVESDPPPRILRGEAETDSEDVPVGPGNREGAPPRAVDQQVGPSGRKRGAELDLPRHVPPRRERLLLVAAHGRGSPEAQRLADR